MAVWDLSVTVEDLGADAPPITVSVTSDLHIGGVILKLVEKSQVKRDWSDHALWWEQKQQWLLRTAWTLEKCGIQADAGLIFMPQHKPLRLGLPNGLTLRLRACFSGPVFHTVLGICKMLNIRRPEELSLLRTVEEKKKKKDKDLSEEVYDLTEVPLTSVWDLSVTVEDLGADAPPITVGSSSKLVEKSQAAVAPAYGLRPWRSVASRQTLGLIFMPQHKPLRLACHGGLTSGRLFSACCHTVTEKVYKMLSVSQPAPTPEAIAKLYRPASVVDKAHIHSSWLDSSRSLMQQGVQENDRLWLRFKYYCFHDLEPKYDVVRLTQMYEQARWAILLEDIDCTEEEMMLFGALQYHINKLSLSEPQTMTSSPAMDDLDSALQCLEVKLDGADSSPQDMLENLTAPELNDYLKIFRPKRLTLKGYKQYWFNSFQSEVQSIRSFLAMQQTNPNTHNTHTDDSMSINTHSLVSPRYSKKYKVKQLTPRILEAFQNVAQLSLTDALLRFLQIWQALPDFGISFMVVRFKGSRKDEVLGIAPNRLICIDLGVGYVVKTWRYNNMRQWNVNWDKRQVTIEFDENVNIAFSCVTADCQIVHEFIGGYVFMSTRSLEQSDTLNEELFHKLTGGHKAL
ncbi:unnamed protein product, partial [Coregonus sp. 'balchen']